MAANALLRELLERRTAPQPERPVEQLTRCGRLINRELGPGSGQGLEPARVHLFRLHVQQVAR